MKMNKLLLSALAALLCVGANAANVSMESDAADIPPFTPFDLGASVIGYIIQGTIYSAAGATAATMVIDTPNDRVAFVFGPVGTFITTPTDSWNFNIPGTFGACFLYPGFGYDDLAESFTKITSAPGSKKNRAVYQGFTKDSFSCNQNIMFTFTEQKIAIPIITEMFAALPSPVGSVCRQGQAYFIADTETLDLTSNRDAYFVLPPSCAAPIDYCSAAYPCGNACAVDCCPSAADEVTCN